MSSASAISAPRAFGAPSVPARSASAKFWKLAGALPVHCRIASAAHCADCFEWQLLHAFGMPSFAETSGRGIRIEWSWRGSTTMYVVVGMWHAAQLAPAEPSL